MRAARRDPREIRMGAGGDACASPVWIDRSLREQLRCDGASDRSFAGATGPVEQVGVRGLPAGRQDRSEHRARVWMSFKLGEQRASMLARVGSEPTDHGARTADHNRGDRRRRQDDAGGEASSNAARTGRSTLQLLREPGGVHAAERVRELVKDPALTIGARAEALLYAAARAQLVEEALEPLLSSGTWVLLDRFVDSSLAYQGAGRGLGVEAVREINLFATGGLTPDRTLLLTLAPSVGPGAVAVSWRDARSARARARRVPRPDRLRLRGARRRGSGTDPKDRCRPGSGACARGGARRARGPSLNTRGGAPARTPTRRRPSPSARASAASIRARHESDRSPPPAVADRRDAAAPRRRGISAPVTSRAAAITSRTENPLPFPRLKMRCSPAGAPSSASRCAAARSSM